MDMKRILQAIDGAATKPVAGASDMSKFLRIVSEDDINPQQDPKFAQYAQLMAKYDMLAGEMTPDASGVAKNASPEFAQQVAALKSQADQLAGPNAQAWDAARKAGSAPQQAPAQLATQLEETDMTKFLSIVDKNDVQILNEGANPHKVSLPVQMAMQHYQQPVTKKAVLKTTIEKYFLEAEEAINQEKDHKRQLLNQYASTIANRVLMKESSSKKKSSLTEGADERKQNALWAQITAHEKAAKKSKDLKQQHHLKMADQLRSQLKTSDLEESLLDSFNRRRIIQFLAKKMDWEISYLELATDHELIKWYKEVRAGRKPIEEARQSAQVKLQKAFQREQEKSEASRKRGEEVMAKAKADSEKKQQSENFVPGHSSGFKPGAGPGLQSNEPTEESVLPSIKPKTPKAIKPKAKTSSCRAGQVQTGMQTKDGKLVPKCSVK